MEKSPFCSWGRGTFGCWLLFPFDNPSPRLDSLDITPRPRVLIQAQSGFTVIQRNRRVGQQRSSAFEMAGIESLPKIRPDSLLPRQTRGLAAIRRHLHPLPAWLYFWAALYSPRLLNGAIGHQQLNDLVRDRTFPIWLYFLTDDRTLQEIRIQVTRALKCPTLAYKIESTSLFKRKSRRDPISQ